MTIEYSIDGKDWSPRADFYHMDSKKITKSLILYIFEGEYNIFNQFAGPLFDYIKQFDDRIYYVFNGMWVIHGRNPYIQIIGADKKDRVLIRFRFWF